ncbi:hypothetical protein CR513_62706, partial [Mucuna pruriens]
MIKIFSHSCKSSFILDTQGSNNIIIAQEMFHSMHNRKEKVGCMTIKIDLEKAYDRLQHSFVQDTFEDISMSQIIVDLIWYCISTSRIKVVSNGEVLKEMFLNNSKHKLAKN